MGEVLQGHLMHAKCSVSRMQQGSLPFLKGAVDTGGGIQGHLVLIERVGCLQG
jgi:hypothetical protein